MSLLLLVPLNHNTPLIRSHLIATQTRYPTIDLLRGLSILAVILLHSYIRFYLDGFDITAGLSKPLAHFLFFNGGNGVTVFFAISGFLITWTSSNASAASHS